jgi:hypothetical protein
MSKKLSPQQRIFNKVASHLLRQNKKSTIPGEPQYCAYRGKDGLRCALGTLITNQNYSQGLDGAYGGGVGYPEVYDSIIKSYPFCEGQVQLLHDLQSIHDMQKPSRWRQKLSVLAKKYNLKMVPNAN